MFKWITRMFAPPTDEEIAAKEKNVVEKTKTRINKELAAWNKDPVGYRISFWAGRLNNREQKEVKNYCLSIGWDFSYSFKQYYGWLRRAVPHIDAHPPSMGTKESR